MAQPNHHGSALPNMLGLVSFLNVVSVASFIVHDNIGMETKNRSKIPAFDARFSTFGKA